MSLLEELYMKTNMIPHQNAKTHIPVKPNDFFS
jgi:hypothetical protein